MHRTCSCHSSPWPTANRNHRRPSSLSGTIAHRRTSYERRKPPPTRARRGRCWQIEMAEASSTRVHRHLNMLQVRAASSSPKPFVSCRARPRFRAAGRTMRHRRTAGAKENDPPSYAGPAQIEQVWGHGSGRNQWSARGDTIIRISSVCDGRAEANDPPPPSYGG